MKKYFNYFIILLFLSFIGMVNVNADIETYTCEYGELKSNGNWTKQYEFDINIQRGSTNEVTFNLKQNSSPKMSGGADWTAFSENAGFYRSSLGGNSLFSTEAIISKLYNKRILELLFENEPDRSRYSNDDDYKEAMRKHYCLTSIKEETNVTKVGNYNVTRFFGINFSTSKVALTILHASDMTINDLENEVGFFKGLWNFIIGYTEDTEVVHLIEKGSKDLDPKILDADCSTFTIYLVGIMNSAAMGCDGNAEFDKRYLELVDLCNSYRQTAHYATKNSNSNVVAKSCSTACSYLYSQIDKMCGKTSSNASCGSLGHKFVSWLFKIIKFVRYAIPALLIILSILDYIKAIAADSEDEMKKVVSRFSKRLIAAALIFIMPFVLEFILNLFNLPGLNADNIFCAK